MEFANRLRANIARTALIGLLAGAMCLGLAACGGEAAPSGSGGSSAATPTQPAASTDGATAKEVKVALTEWKIEVGETELPAGKVKFTVINDGQQTHNLTILQGDKEIARTPNFKKEEGNQTLEAGLQPGAYQFICSIPGHPEKGMKTDVTVK